MWCEGNQTLNYIVYIVCFWIQVQTCSEAGKLTYRLDVRSRYLWRVGEGVLAGLLGCQ